MSDPRLLEIAKSVQSMDPNDFLDYRASASGSARAPAPAPVGVQQAALPPGMLGPQAGFSQNMYGTMPVPQSMLDVLNARFGWDPQGIAHGRATTAPSNYYAPPMVYPDVTMPRITGG